MKKYNFCAYDFVKKDGRDSIRLSGYFFFMSFFLGIFSVNVAIYLILCAIYMRITEG